MGSKYLVLGAGVGKAITYALARSVHTQLVAIGDIDIKKAGGVSCFISARRKQDGVYYSKCVPMYFDAEKTQNLAEIFKQFDVVISALPAKHNLGLAEAAIRTSIRTKKKVHFCDLGGVVKITKQMLKLNDKYPNMPVSVIPDCGLMPGLGIIIAKKLMNDLGGADSIEILVGGLPQKPRPPVFYQCVFSIEGLKHICYDSAPVLINGKVKLVPPFYDYELMMVPELAKFSKTFGGMVETFATAGASMAHLSFQKDGVKYFSEKTVRRPGFVSFCKKIPPDRFEETIMPHINTPVDSKNPDLVWMQVTAQNGSANKSVSLLDLFDPETGLTAMQRTTGFTTAIIAEMIAEGKAKPGVNTPENAFDDSGINEVIDRVGDFLTLKEN